VFERAGLILTLDEVAARIKYIARHGSELELELDSVPLKATVERQGAGFRVTLKTGSWQLKYLDPLKRRGIAKAGPARLVAPVHGRVLDVLVGPGAAVKRGQALMLLECMKLEYRVTAPADGTVDALHFAAGDVVEDGVQLVDFTPTAG
jgi:3-methylcrotonyl-CoA carboxylase alpha subunit